MSEFDFLYSKIKKWLGDEGTLGFFVSFVGGLLTHMYIMAGNYPTYSGLNLFLNNGSWHALEGRWFAAIIENIDGVVTQPFFNGLIAISFWSLSVVCIIKLFNIKRKSVIIFVSIILISYPVVAAMFCFEYMVDTFGISTFCACFATYLVECKKSYVCGIICMVLSLGAYQANLSIYMILVVCIVCLELLDNVDIISVLRKIRVNSICVIIALVIYYAIFKVYLLVANIESYRDFTLSFSSVAKGIIKCYGGAYWFWGYGSFWSLGFGKIIKCFLLFCFVFIIVGRIICKINDYDKKFLRFLLLTCIAIITPIFANYAFVVSPDENRTYRQFIAHGLLVVLPLILCDRYLDEIRTRIQNRVAGLICRYISITLIGIYMLTVVFFESIDNTAYMNSNLIFEKDYSFAERVVDRIEQFDEYEKGMPVILVFRKSYDKIYGGTIENAIDNYIPGMEQSGYSAISTPTGLKHFISLFVLTDINFSNENVSEDILNQIGKWPSNDCIIVSDGKLYICIT